MSFPRNDIDDISLIAAREIEDEFARGHTGGAVQRRAAIQTIVTKSINGVLDLVVARAVDVQTRARALE